MCHGKIRVILPVMFLTLVLSVMGCGSEDKYVTLVKTGSLQMEPNIKIGKAFGEFFSNPKWTSFESSDNMKVVEFNGDCTWNDKPARCTVQFIIRSDTEFEVHYVSINDVGMNDIDSAAILHKALTNRDY